MVTELEKYIICISQIHYVKHYIYHIVYKHDGGDKMSVDQLSIRTISFKRGKHANIGRELYCLILKELAVPILYSRTLNKINKLISLCRKRL